MENELSIIKCRRCGKVLPPGSLKYIVQIHITADFDNYITEEEFNEEVPLERIVESVEKQGVRAERDVMDDVAFFLCNKCKNIFMKNPSGEQMFEDSEDKNFLH